MAIRYAPPPEPKPEPPKKRKPGAGRKPAADPRVVQSLRLPQSLVEKLPKGWRSDVVAYLLRRYEA